jgi:hypothetical protein
MNRLGQKLVHCMCRVGHNQIYGVNTVILSGRSPNIRSYTMYVHNLANPMYVWYCGIVSAGNSQEHISMHGVRLRFWLAL